MDTGSLTAFGGASDAAAGSGGSINAAASGGYAHLGTIAAYGGDSSGSAGGQGGSASVSCIADLTVASVNVNGGSASQDYGGNGGSVSLSAGTLSVSSITACGGAADSYYGGTGGTITATSLAGAAKIDSVNAFGGDGGSGAGGGGGSVTVSSSAAIGGSSGTTISIDVHGGTGSGDTGGDGGYISVTAGTTLDTGSLTAFGGASDAAAGSGGSINAAASGGYAHLGTIAAYGGDSSGSAGGQGGSASVSCIADLTVASVNVNGGSASQDYGGNGGSVSLSAGTLSVSSITACGGAADSYYGGTGGTITATSLAGAAKIDSVNAFGGDGGSGAGGGGGSVTVSSSAAIGGSSGTAISIDVHGGNGSGDSGGGGGLITLTAATIDASVLNLTGGGSDSTGGSAGSLNATTTGYAKFSAIYATGADSDDYAGTGGGITITSTGDLSSSIIDASGGRSTGSDGATGGVITLTGATISVSSITANGGGSDSGAAGFGGSIAAKATAGYAKIDTLSAYGADSSSGTGGDGGKISIVSSGALRGLSGLNTSIDVHGGSGSGDTSGNGGSITLNSATIDAGTLNVSGGYSPDNAAGSGGTITASATGAYAKFNSFIATGGDADGNNGGAGASITITSAGAVILPSVNVSAGYSASGDGAPGGSIHITAGTTIDAGNLVAYGGYSQDSGVGGQGGSINANALGGYATFGSVAAVGGDSDGDSGGNGGTVVLSSTGTLTAPSIIATPGYSCDGCDGSSGGSIQLTTTATLSTPYINASGADSAGSSASGGSGGSIMITAGLINAHPIIFALGGTSSDDADSLSGGAGGTVKITATSMTLTANTQINVSGGGAPGDNGGTSGTGGSGGSISIQGGSLNINASAQLVTRGGYDSTGYSDDEGNNYDGGSGGQGGPVTIVASTSLQFSGFIDTSGGGSSYGSGGTAGSVGLVTTGSSDLATNIGSTVIARTVTLTSSQNLTTNGNIFAATTNVTSGGDIVNAGSISGIANFTSGRDLLFTKAVPISSIHAVRDAIVSFGQSNFSFPQNTTVGRNLIINAATVQNSFTQPLVAGTITIQNPGGNLTVSGAGRLQSTGGINFSSTGTLNVSQSNGLIGSVSMTSPGNASLFVVQGNLALDIGSIDTSGTFSLTSTNATALTINVHQQLRSQGNVTISNPQGIILPYFAGSTTGSKGPNGTVTFSASAKQVTVDQDNIIGRVLGSSAQDFKITSRVSDLTVGGSGLAAPGIVSNAGKVILSATNTGAGGGKLTVVDNSYLKGAQDVVLSAGKTLQIGRVDSVSAATGLPVNTSLGTGVQIEAGALAATVVPNGILPATAATSIGAVVITSGAGGGPASDVLLGDNIKITANGGLNDPTPLLANNLGTIAGGINITAKHNFASGANLQLLAYGGDLWINASNSILMSKGTSRNSLISLAQIDKSGTKIDLFNDKHLMIPLHSGGRIGLFAGIPTANPAKELYQIVFERTNGSKLVLNPGSGFAPTDNTFIVGSDALIKVFVVPSNPGGPKTTNGNIFNVQGGVVYLDPPPTSSIDLARFTTLTAIAPPGPLATSKAAGAPPTPPTIPTPPSEQIRVVFALPSFTQTFNNNASLTATTITVSLPQVSAGGVANHLLHKYEIEDTHGSTYIAGGACQPIFLGGDEDTLLVGDKGTALSPQGNRNVVLEEGRVVAMIGKQAVTVDAGVAQVHIAGNSTSVVQATKSLVRIQNLAGHETEITVERNGKTNTIHAAAGEEVVLADEALCEEELIAVDGVDRTPVDGTVSISGMRVVKNKFDPKMMVQKENLLLCSSGSFYVTRRIQQLKADTHSNKIKTPPARRALLQSALPSVYKPIAAVAPMLPPGRTQVISVSNGSARVKHEAGAKLSFPGPNLILLESGEILVSAIQRTVVRGADTTVFIKPGTIVQVTLKDKVLQVKNLWDCLGASGVEQIVAGRKILLAPGQESITGPSKKHVMQSVSLDPVGRRSQMVTEVGEKHVMRCEFSPQSLLTERQWLRGLMQSDGVHDRQIIARIMKMSAVLSTVTSRHGAFTGGH